MNREYIEKLDDAYRVKGTRISLDSIVYSFWRGETPESIAQSYPLLSLEQVYGSLTYYLAHKDEVDTYLKVMDEEYESLRKIMQDKDPMFYKKLSDSRRSKELV